jgi:hypothetical protein
MKEDEAEDPEAVTGEAVLELPELILLFEGVI